MSRAAYIYWAIMAVILLYIVYKLTLGQKIKAWKKQSLIQKIDQMVDEINSSYVKLFNLQDSYWVKNLFIEGEQINKVIGKITKKEDPKTLFNFLLKVADHGRRLHLAVAQPDKELQPKYYDPITHYPLDPVMQVNLMIKHPYYGAVMLKVNLDTAISYVVFGEGAFIQVGYSPKRHGQCRNLVYGKFDLGQARFMALSHLDVYNLLFLDNNILFDEHFKYSPTSFPEGMDVYAFGIGPKGKVATLGKPIISDVKVKNHEPDKDNEMIDNILCSVGKL